MSSPNQAVIGGVNTDDILGGKYRVEKVLGVGGMGVVVSARHVDLGTLVALKFLLPDALTNAESVERFSREARAMVRLTSPHSARVFDVGKLANGAPYMVMELLVGEDLGELIDGTREHLPVAVAVDWILQACVGIAEAHALGIIHRDIKPRNLFLARQRDGSSMVKVLDFGLAKSERALGVAERALTQTTAIMGSPAYMSPEQMRALREVDATTDIWSLGVCLYELLTGTTPFDAPTVAELCALVLTATPRPPEVFRADITPELSATIMRCLEKDRTRRFRDIGELADALRKFTEAGGRSASKVRSQLAAPPDRAAFDVGPEKLGAVPQARPSDTKTVVSVETREERSHTVAIVVALCLVLLAAGGLVTARRLHRPEIAAVVPAAEPPPPAESKPPPSDAPPALDVPPSAASAAPAASPAPAAPAASITTTTVASSRATHAHPPPTAKPPPPPSKPVTKVDAAPTVTRPITTAF